MLKMTSGRIIELPNDDEENRINAGILADEETYELTDNEFKQLIPHKVNMNINVDYDILTYFQETGADWQLRVNQVLRDWLKQQTAKTP